MLHGGRRREVNGQRQGAGGVHPGYLSGPVLTPWPPSPFRRGGTKCQPPAHDMALLLRRFQRMVAPFVEIILQSQALLVGFDRADRLYETFDLRFSPELPWRARPPGA